MVASGKMAPVPPVLIQEDAADSDDEDGADFTVGLFASAADTKVRLTPQLLFLPPPHVPMNVSLHLFWDPTFCTGQPTSKIQ